MKVCSHNCKPFSKNTQYCAFWGHFCGFFDYTLSPLRHTLPITPTDSPSNSEFLVQIWTYNCKLFWSYLNLFLFFFLWFSGSRVLGRAWCKKNAKSMFLRYSLSNCYENWHVASFWDDAHNAERKILNLGFIPGFWNSFFRRSFGNNLGNRWAISTKLRPSPNLTISNT